MLEETFVDNIYDIYVWEKEKRQNVRGKYIYDAIRNKHRKAGIHVVIQHPSIFNDSTTFFKDERSKFTVHVFKGKLR